MTTIKAVARIWDRDAEERLFVAVLAASMAAPGTMSWGPEKHVNFARRVVRTCYTEDNGCLRLDYRGKEDEKQKQ